MAVKQDNTETNDAPAAAGNNAGTTSTSNGVKLNTTTVGGAAKKKMFAQNSDGSIGGGGVGGIGNGSNDLIDQANCKSNNKATNASLNGDNCSGPNNSGPKSEMEKLLILIEAIEKRQKNNKLNPFPQMMAVYERIIIELARVPMRQSPEDLKRVKDDIAKVGAYLAKPNEKSVYLIYLRIVCKLITEAPNETPSCAIAVVFQLFCPEQIIEAVQELLSINIPDASIRKTVSLLCDWVRFSNVCQNLNLWIMAIINGMHEQEKYALLDEIALENIEKVFALMILPILRNKVAPIVFKMLTTIHQTPEIFLKIVPKIPFVMRVLKHQSSGAGADDTRICIQKMVDVTSSLMFRFYNFDSLYGPVVMALKDYQPSYDYLKITNGEKNEDDDLNCLLQNKSNARVGLVNLGNTCYMNSVLQALAMTKEFSRELLLIENVSPLLLKMQQQIALMHYSARFELTPTRVLNATRPPGFSPGLQQDSSEFLGYLLDTLHEQEVAYQPKHKNNVGRGESIDSGCSTTRSPEGAEAAVVINEVPGNVIIPYGNSNSRNNCASYNPTPPNTPTKGTNNPTRTQSHSLVPSTIEKTFTGKLATMYKCLNCGWQSRNVDSFRDLQLSFPEAKNDCSATNYSVQDLVDYYCSPEKLDGDNQYYCEQCKKLTDAERYISVISAPKNLILTLKHFKYDQKYHMRAKLMHKVFHDEKVTVKVCGSDTPDEIVHYDLYAGVVHSGFSMDSGHYYTYAADESNNWFKFNDNIVTHSKSEELHNLTPPNTPYILFYQMSARSNESSEAAASAKVVKIDIPLPLKLDQLPHHLRDYINNDNGRFNEELKMQRFKELKAKRSNDTYDTINRYGNNNNDDDDQTPPPSANSCGGNSMNMNINRFVY